MNLTSHQRRVIEEHKDLTEKLNKLQRFFTGHLYASLPEREQGLLRAQSQFMNGYAEVLAQRIEAFIAEQN